MKLGVSKKAALTIFLVCLVGVVALAVYESLPRPSNPGPSTYWVEYILTKNGNHTQIKSIYSDGGGAIEQVNWLSFDNKTAVHNYFGCTPSQAGCTVDGCPFTVLDDNATEYHVKVVCPPGA